MRPRDMSRQPHAADPVLEERTVLDMVRRRGVRGAAVTSIDETGGEARVYVIDDTLVVKVQRPHRLGEPCDASTRFPRRRLLTAHSSLGTTRGRRSSSV